MNFKMNETLFSDLFSTFNTLQLLVFWFFGSKQTRELSNRNTYVVRTCMSISRSGLITNLIAIWLKIVSVFALSCVNFVLLVSCKFIKLSRKLVPQWNIRIYFSGIQNMALACFATNTKTFAFSPNISLR